MLLNVIVYFYNLTISLYFTLYHFLLSKITLFMRLALNCVVTDLYRYNAHIGFWHTKLKVSASKRKCSFVLLNVLESVVTERAIEREGERVGQRERHRERRGEREWESVELRISQNSLYPLYFSLSLSLCFSDCLSLYISLYLS